MLATQVQYFNVVELRRHNKATESETSRHNVQTEKLGFDTLTETVRHNKAQEQYWQDSLAESKRHNQVTESQGWENIDVAWMNAATNRIMAEVAQENARTAKWSAQANYNLGYDANTIAQMNAETNRARQVADENYQNAQKVIGFMNSSAAATNAATNRMSLTYEAIRTDTQKARSEHQNMTDTWHSINESLDITRKTVETGMGMYKSFPTGEEAMQPINTSDHSVDQPYKITYYYTY